MNEEQLLKKILERLINIEEVLVRVQDNLARDLPNARPGVPEFDSAGNVRRWHRP